MGDRLVRRWLIAISLFAAGSQSKKWLVASGMGIIGIFISFVLYKDMKHLFLVLAVFLIPLRIDFYINFKKSYFALSGYPGLPVTAFDIVFLGLFLFFLFQVARGEERIEFFPCAEYSGDIICGLVGYLGILRSGSCAEFFQLFAFHQVLSDIFVFCKSYPQQSGHISDCHGANIRRWAPVSSWRFAVCDGWRLFEGCIWCPSDIVYGTRRLE